MPPITDCCCYGHRSSQFTLTARMAAITKCIITILRKWSAKWTGTGQHRYLWLVGMALLIVGGCAEGQTNRNAPGVVGMQEAELMGAKGQPQQTIATPEGGKILVYENQRLDQVAVMGGGAWGKTEQTYYWLDAQGKVEKVKYYPFGKRKFLFPSDQGGEEVTPTPTKLAKAQAPPEAPTPSRPLPLHAPETTEPLPSKLPASAPAHRDMTKAAGLELLMSKEDVTHLLGLPDRTEGFWAEGKPVVVWTYRLGNPRGPQVLTPLVFENGRLSGWGDAYYLTILRKARPQIH
jgi:hypothetical protein